MDITTATTTAAAATTTTTTTTTVMSNNELSGDALIAEAEKMSGGVGNEKDTAIEAAELCEEDTAIEAAELYEAVAVYYKLAELCEAAAIHYKLDKKWSKAGAAYVKAGEYYIQAVDTHDAARRFNDAAIAYQKTDVDLAVSSMQRASDIYASSGRFSAAAKSENGIARIYEAQGNLTEAAVHFQKSADFYETEGQNYSRDGALLKVAHFMGLLGEYTGAFERFEKVAQASANEEFGKFEFGARDYFLNAVLCLLATGDNIAVRKALDNYSSIYFKWADSREAKFLSSLASAAERLDGSAFAAIVQDYHSFLDEWKTAVLAKAREKIVENEHVELAV